MFFLYFKDRRSWRKWRNRLGQRTAETLLEVIIALFVVAMGSAAGTTLIVSSLRANTFSQDNLLALNLAGEAMESVRNIRDTNWMKFNFDKPNCWNVVPETTAGGCVAPSYPHIAAGTYSLDLHPVTYAIKLTAVPVALDLNNNLATNDNYQLGYVDTNTANGTGDRDMFVTSAFIASEGLSDSGDSKFHRMVEIAYHDTSDPATSEEMTVTVTVQWQQNGVHQVQLSTTLTNY